MPAKGTTTRTMQLAEAQAKMSRLLPSQQAFLNFPKPSDINPQKPQSIFLKLICGGYACGKALSLDTRVPTPTGWTTMGDIKVGDQVFDENGQPCNVIGVSPVMEDRPCYEVEFDNRTKVIADAEHEWKTITMAETNRHARQTLKKAGIWGKPLVTTEEIAQTINYGHGVGPTHAVALCPVIGEERKLPLHPYLFGCWLGDGDTSAPVITSADSGIIETIKSFGYDVSEGKRDKRGNNKALRYSIYGIRPIMRQLGVLGHKRIPDLYLRSSYEQRLWLLKGLMDTDGYVDYSGACEFTTTKNNFALEVYELIGSLGLKATLSCGEATLNKRFISMKYRIRFVAEFPVCHLERKASKQKGSTQGWSRKRFIVAAKPIKSVPVRCILVDSPSHLFLITDQFIPTHNTRICLQNCLLLSAMFPRNQGMIMRYHGKDLEESVIPLFFEVCPESWIKDVFKRGKTGMVVTLVNDSQIFFKHLHDAGGAGQTKTRRVGANLGWFFISQVEEADQAHWVSMLGRLRNPAAKIKMGIADANPNGRNWVQRSFFPNYTPLDPKNGIYFREYRSGNTLGVHVNSEENRETNGGFVTDDFFDNFIANSDPAIVQRYIHGSMEDFSGKVFPSFKHDSVHVIKEFPISEYRNWEFVGGIDVGGACPWSVVPVYVDEWGNLIVTPGFDKATGRTGEVADWIKSNTPWNETRSIFVIDPENKVAAVELSERKIFTQIAEKAVLPGILRMNGYFHLRKRIAPPAWFVKTQSDDAIRRILKEGCPRVFVFETATTFIREHDSCVWDEKKVDQIRKTNTARFDQVDGFRYVCMTRPEPTKLLSGPEQKYAELRAVSPISAREWEQLDKRLANRTAALRGQTLIDAYGDFDQPIKEIGKTSYDWGN